jgi:hypothetical protein
VADSHAMPASTRMRADDAQYDHPLRGALLHAEGPPVAGTRASDAETIVGGGQAGRPQHGPWVVPGLGDIIPDSRALPRCLAEARILLYSRPAAAAGTESQRHRRGPAGLAGAGNPSPAFSPRDRRRACVEGGQ